MNEKEKIWENILDSVQYKCYTLVVYKGVVPHFMRGRPTPWRYICARLVYKEQDSYAGNVCVWVFLVYKNPY